MGEIIKRVFIVGVARSGTTLIQSMLANHSMIHTFPESHFFRLTIPKKKILRLFHRIKNKDKAYIKHFLSDHSRDHLFEEYKGSAANLNQWSKYLIDTIDRISLSHQKSIWLEKTPMHLYYIDIIEKNTSNAYFIHVIREPKANIAALHEVSKNHPESFEQNTLNKALTRYINDIKQSEKYINAANHCLLHYEDLINDTEVELKNICSFLNIEYETSLKENNKFINTITSNEEAWKENNAKDIVYRDKLQQRLSEAEIHWLNRQLSNFSSPILNCYE